MYVVVWSIFANVKSPYQKVRTESFSESNLVSGDGGDAAVASK